MHAGRTVLYMTLTYLNDCRSYLRHRMWLVDPSLLPLMWNYRLGSPHFSSPTGGISRLEPSNFVENLEVFAVQL